MCSLPYQIVIPSQVWLFSLRFETNIALLAFEKKTPNTNATLSRFPPNKSPKVIVKPFSLCCPLWPVRADTVGAQAESSNTWSPLPQSGLISLAWGRRVAVQPDKESILILCGAAAGKRSWSTAASKPLWYEGGRLAADCWREPTLLTPRG